AFGTKAGDLFTRITVVAAAIWIILCILATNVLGTKQSRLSPALGAAAGEAVPAETGDGTTADAEATEMEPAESEITEEPETGTEAESAVETEPAAEPAAE
ncbi:MAG: preprotein translocase subunit SecG, partial [Planctomycetota bacterium]|nr:preprotein translocase subunit SecG [Planctomycetota bacterium]